MEKLNFVNNGGLRLPPGFRFFPTDEELVLHFLKRKVQSRPVASPIITEADVCRSDPWDLPGDPKQERYFYSNMEIKYPNGKRSNRATTSGYWKATGIDKQIVDYNTKQVAGTKKTLVFYRGKAPNGSKTNWIMHEYKLAKPIEGMENWVVCRMFLKKRGRKNGKNDVEGVRIEEAGPIFYDFMAGIPRTGDLNLEPAASSSGSSGVTNASPMADEGEESSKYMRGT
ncbi:hypothetical protein L2E82_42206 [Cichorium intybus]|uniref:Uncharacterized protein n=1 Tax=Cichorium intybus TaxID=13427 RepID=A0ACB8ZLQ6_CICIN|nr:hypothetical protein L2E82_42206 [Cichorium intybus]